MKNKPSLKSKLIISIFIGCLIPYFLGGVYLNKFMENWLYKNHLENTNRLLFQVGELIDRTLIKDMSEVVTMLSGDDRVRSGDDKINNYTEYDIQTYAYKDTETEKLIESYFKTVKESHEAINFIFFGIENGGYIEYPRFQPVDKYDPTQRPWYLNSIYTDQVTISDPYITQVTQEMIISFTKRVVLNTKDIGVVGISVKIEDLTQKIGSIRLGKTGYIVVLNDRNKIIISPKDKEWLLKTPEELRINLPLDVESKVGGVFEGQLNQEEKVVHTYISPISGWKIVAIISKDEILSKSGEMTNILIGIYLLTLVIIFYMVYIVSKKITDPILGIAGIINRMASFDFSSYNNDTIKRYARKNDEIGTIASALSDMQDNFVELMNRISEMDDEIKRIDIKKDTSYKLTLSDNNPFNGIAQSINTLLDKVQSYLEQLKESNKEILEKNQLLKASEEELMTQLEELDSQREYIDFLAFHDPLTNLPNRRKFIEKLEYALNNKISGAVILLDLDNFKSINDTLGHVFGDKVLQGVSERFHDIIHDKVFISRFGGDEFLILLESEGEPYQNQIIHFIKDLYHLFIKKIQIDENEVEIKFSVGISLFPQDSQEVNQLIMNADLALYAVKNSGKNGYQFFESSMTDYLFKKSAVEGIIRDAIENNKFKMVYQPQIHLPTGEVCAYEALLRLKGHEISPAEFIPISEDNGSIIKIGRIVAQEVIWQISKWQKEGYSVKPVAINFSAKQLNDENYLKFLCGELEKRQVDPKYIEIEITENVFLENKEATLAFLVKLKEMGIKISIDDFGTGYSSFSYLTFLPIDKIKLDRSLNIRFLEIENIKVMDCLISLAHSLNLEVVAEGIETYEQFRRLKVGKCDYIQGYYFSRPLEAEDVQADFSKNYYDDKTEL